jgi:hypothetical protein
MRWEIDIGLHDEAGLPVRVTPHQFRHTLGTRMINQGVPQHVVQRMLGHASPQMTARYASIHDTTVRAAFDDYQQRRVDVAGERFGFDPDAPAADAEWVKHNLARVAASLPNGYCGRPPQQDCPHPNACLTCPDFQTTPQFLPLHRRQRDDTLVLLTAAEHAGNHRLADNHRQVAGNLDQVIDALKPSTMRSPTMPADNRAALAAATRNRAVTVRERARTAMRRLDRDGTPISFAAVATAAGVSRSLLYRDPDLRTEIDRLRTPDPLGSIRPPAAERTSDASLQQRLTTALDDNDSLRDDNRKLRDQIAVLLGEQRAATAPTQPRPRMIGPCS